MIVGTQWYQRKLAQFRSPSKEAGLESLRRSEAQRDRYVRARPREEEECEEEQEGGKRKVPVTLPRVSVLEKRPWEDEMDRRLLERERLSRAGMLPHQIGGEE